MTLPQPSIQATATALAMVRQGVYGWRFFASATVLALTWAIRASAIGYFESDYGMVASAPLAQPADLVRPSDNYTATWDFGGNGRASGVVVGPSWILTGGHVANDQSVNIHVGADNGPSYKVAKNAQGQPQIFMHPSLDLGLIRVVAPDGAEPDFDFVPIAAPLEYGTVPVTISGYGLQRVFDSDSGKTDGTVLGVGQLRWGRNIATVGPTSVSARMDKPLDASHAPNAEYVKYESHPMGGDSGGGWFMREGWQWQLVGITSTGGVSLPFPALPADSSGPKVTASDVISWIEQCIGHALPVVDSPALRPAATVRWIGPDNGSWHSLSNWQEVATGASQLPAFEATRADVVSIDAVNGPAVSDSTATAGARDVFVGRATVPENPIPATVHVKAGGRFNADSVFLGTEPGEFGELRLSGGSLTTASQYVGYRGRGSFWHTGGTNTTVSLLVGKDNRGSDTASLYIMGGASDLVAPPSLRAGRIIVGEESDSYGQFVMFGDAYAAVSSMATIVGDHGHGSFDHHIGTHTVQNDLVLGNDFGAFGVYSMSGDAKLKTARTTVGRSGAGSFYQSGGFHETDALRVNESGSYTMLGGTLKTNFIAGKINFFQRSATVIADGLANYVSAEFAEAQNATLEMAPGSLVLVSGSNPFGTTHNQGSLAVHVVGAPLMFSAGGFQGFGDIPDSVLVSGSGHVTAIAGPGRLRLPELHLSDDASVTVQPDAVLEVSSTKNIPLVIAGGSPQITVSDSTLVISHEMAGTGLRVSPGAHLTLNTTEAFTEESLQVFCVQTDVLVESQAVLTATGGINFAVGHRSLSVDGTLQVGTGIGKLDIRSLGLSTDEDVSLHIGSSGRLEIDLEQDQHDVVAIDRGGAVLQGELSLVHGDEFRPAIGDQFDILVADDSISGVFGQVTGNSVDLGFAESRDEIGLAVLYTGVEESSVVRVRASLFGDVDFDNSVDLEDVHQVLVHMGTQQATWEMGDFNGDGRVGQDDFQILAEYLGMIVNPQATAGDFDQNGSVNAADYTVWRKSLGQIGVALAADGNGNKQIDVGDYEIWRSHFGQAISGISPIVAVPEPTTIMLLAAGCLASACRRSWGRTSLLRD